MTTPVGVTLSRAPDELKPVFYSLRSARDVADLLEVPYWRLVYVLYRAPHRYPYRKFWIPKKAGGQRQISAPPLSIRILQSKLNTVLQLVYPAKASAHGFVRERSILTNARKHAGKRFVLNVDLRDFFPSINFGRVRGMFMAKPYQLDARAATVLARICCHDNQLPQGAPTSPVVSNMICARLDSQLQHLARENRCTYTRYADDLTFSTTLSRFPEQLARADEGWTGRHLTLGADLVSVIESNGFRVNQDKQRLQCRSCHQEVTGLTVNKFPNVRRRFVRRVRAMLHAWDKYQLEGAETEFRARYDLRSRQSGSEAPSFAQVVRGKLAFLEMVKGPADPTYRRLANKLHRLAPNLIAQLPEPPPPGRDDLWPFWVEQYRGLVFQLEVRKPNDRIGHGSAFAWRGTALATAAHNICGQLSASPPLPEGQPFSESDVLLHPRSRDGVDVALLLLPSTSDPIGHGIPVRADPVSPGEEVAVLGHASRLLHQQGLVFRQGFVESSLPYLGKVDHIQVTIPFVGGMSGAPVIDRLGQLIGVAVATSRAEDEDEEEETEDDVARRSFNHVIPARYLVEMDAQRASMG